MDVAKKIPDHITQMLVVKPDEGMKATMTLCERRQGAVWQEAVAIPPFEVVVGKHGIAPRGEKQEGDFKTPAGIYPIGDAFGFEPMALEMDYKYITKDDKFIDDVESKQYNTWVTGPTDAKSYEHMFIETYVLGAVVRYNMNPIVPGAGSAIFIHVWRAPDSPTAGCVAMSKQDIWTLLHWLDKKQHPHIMMHAK